MIARNLLVFEILRFFNDFFNFFFKNLEYKKLTELKNLKPIVESCQCTLGGCKFGVKV